MKDLTKFSHKALSVEQQKDLAINGGCYCRMVTDPWCVCQKRNIFFFCVKWQECEVLVCD